MNETKTEAKKRYLVQLIRVEVAEIEVEAANAQEAENLGRDESNLDWIPQELDVVVEEVES